MVEADPDEDGLEGEVVAGGVCCASALPSNRVPAANRFTAVMKDLCI